MKKASIAFLFIIILISYKNVIFASYNSEVFGEELHHHVERVFKERSEIWNKILMGQYIHINEIEEDLNKIIVSPLLEFDVEIFEQILNNPTSYEAISDVTIKNIYIVKSGFNQVELKTTIIWDVIGYDNEYTEEVKYIVKMEKIKDNWFLSNYEISK